nr:M20/M25/M40 family metallo-hydrolase [uncultured Undibacterium sp.]
MRNHLSVRFIFSLCALLVSATSLAQSNSSQAMQDVQYLASEAMQGREIGSAGNALAREYIIKRITELGLKPCGGNYVHEFKVNKLKQATQGKNILACQYAKQNPAAKYLVVSAHYDHIGVNNNKIYYGADDNASGVAGVLAVAQNLKDSSTKHHIVYAFFDGEERGLLGAHAFVKEGIIPSKDIAANLNFDMIARGDKKELFVSGTYQNPTLKPILQTLNTSDDIKVLFDHDRPEQGSNDWTSQSDHYAFFQAGIPHLYFGVEDHADYHKSTDTFDKINPKFFDACIAFLQKAVMQIDQRFTHKD